MCYDDAYLLNYALATELAAEEGDHSWENLDKHEEKIRKETISTMQTVGWKW